MELAKCFDPDVLGEMFAREIISFPEKLAIQDSKAAGELMMDCVFRKWNKGTYEKFLHVLKKCGYESHVTRLKGIIIVTHLTLMILLIMQSYKN